MTITAEEKRSQQLRRIETTIVPERSKKIIESIDKEIENASTTNTSVSYKVYDNDSIDSMVCDNVVKHYESYGYKAKVNRRDIHDEEKTVFIIDVSWW